MGMRQMQWRKGIYGHTGQKQKTVEPGQWEIQSGQRCLAVGKDSKAYALGQGKCMKNIREMIVS